MVLLRLFRDLPVGWKLAASVAGALSLLCGLSWFALDRLAFVTSVQGAVAETADISNRIQASLVASQELRVLSRAVQTQQTLGALTGLVKRAEAQTQVAADLLKDTPANIDPGLMADARSRLQRVLDTVHKVADLRAEILTLRQKRLFQAQSTFDGSLTTLGNELARGSALSSGVDSVRAGGEDSKGQDTVNPQLAEMGRYRIAMSHLEQAALMFLATGNGGAANDIRAAKQGQEDAMTALLNDTQDAAIRSDIRTTQTIGKGIADASFDLISKSRSLDDLVGTEMDKATQALQESFGALSGAIGQRQQAAIQTARDSGDAARRNIRIVMGGAAVLLVVVGMLFTRLIAGPIRHLTRAVQAIASGVTEQAVPYTDQRDELGRMAASVESLRGIMRETFIKSQMLEQLPIGVMTAAASGDHAITYCNPKARWILDLVKDALPRGPEEWVGRSIAMFDGPSVRPVELVADPANLPFKTRIDLGAEALDLRVSAIRDSQGQYAGPLLIWRRATDQARLVDQFEQSVGGISRIVANAAIAMKEAAATMRASTVEAGVRTLAVSAASDQASHSVSAAAVGAEQVAMSVGQIGQQVAESARIAAHAVAEAEATNASVGSLARAAENISAIISLIRDVAGRTNLLALNATIEAARAGEAGKGFAVVASEVKNLAIQTAKATENIGQQIEKMQHTTADAVAALQRIGVTIDRMNGIATAIADAVDQQGHATQSIATAVQHAAAGTAEVNSNIAAVTAVVEETSEKAGGVLDAATAMTEQAQLLQSEVASFLQAVQRAA
jgi:methyl-accepting chemotaxis protein